MYAVENQGKTSFCEQCGDGFHKVPALIKEISELKELVKKITDKEDSLGQRPDMEEMISKMLDRQNGALNIMRYNKNTPIERDSEDTQAVEYILEDYNVIKNNVKENLMQHKLGQLKLF
ncbi:hypothetical protein JTB14_031531 [Gonioctena quinquepunctata]|nr:hypothetical protein JTB14_031531 [Gonioctena quinquepunctata]